MISDKDNWTDEQIDEYNRNPCLLPCQKLIRVGDEVLAKGTARHRALVPDPNGSGELVSYSTARLRKKLQTPEGRASHLHKSRRRQSLKLQRIPNWVTALELKQIEQFYQIAAYLGLSVDHTIPLCGAYVCGFHCLANLDFLTIAENSSKSNKFIPM